MPCPRLDPCMHGKAYSQQPFVRTRLTASSQAWGMSSQPDLAAPRGSVLPLFDHGNYSLPVPVAVTMAAAFGPRGQNGS